ncbi:MAG: carboxypeptidase regulatory-like domain-containing protein, partial [Thermoanaerobaculia bacterium]
MRRIAIAVFACVTATLPLSATITGTLVNSDGQAVADAKLSIFALETPDATSSRRISATTDRAAIATATSDSKGKFSFESPKDPVVVLNISATGFAPAAIAVERDDERGAILLTSAPMKQGRITANGKGVAAAKIIVAGGGAEFIATTDAEGRYSVPDPSKWADHIAILHPDYVIAHDLAQRLDNRKIDLDRTLDAGTTVTGRVLADDGKTPVTGATLLISGFPVAKSADDGSFTIAHAPKKWQSVEARFGSMSGEREHNGEGAIAIKVARTATINGTIRDAKTQSAVAGALVRAGAPNRFVLLNVAGGAVTDSKGSFSLSLPPGNYELTTSRPGYAIANTSVNVGANAKAMKNLVATRLARVSGSVIDENKAPVAGTRIEAGAVSREPGLRMFRNNMSVDQSAIAAPDGSFVVRVEPDADVQIEAKKKGYPEARSATMRFAPGERKAGLVLTIPQGVTVAGHVVDHAGKPLAGIAVSATEAVSGGGNFVRRQIRFGGNRDEDNAVKTGGDGRFTMRLKPGTYSFTLKGEGLASKTINAKPVTASMQPIEVTMDAGAVLAGRITRAGAGVQGVSVDVFGGEDQGSAETGADGAFRITGLTPGQAMLNAYKQEDFIQQFRPVTIPADNLVIDLPAGGRITGRVVEKESKQPVTTFDAGFSSARGGGGMMFMGPPLSRHFTSDDGTFVLESVPPGATNVVVNAPGYTAGRVANVNVEDGKTVENVEVEMDRGVHVTGHVTGPDGQALSGVTVTTQTPNSRMRGLQGGGGGVTDGSGEYSIDNVESGDKTFSFDRNGYLTTTKTATLSGTDARVDAQMSTGMTLTGLVVTDAGVPIADAGVSASSASDSAFGGRSTRTDANGQFQMDGLAPGRYTFRASKTGVASGTLKDFDISSGAPVRIVLQQGGVITGHITGISGDEMSRAGVVAQGAGNTYASGTVDSSGSFRIDGAPTGTVRVSASVSSGLGGRSTPQKSVQLEA